MNLHRSPKPTAAMTLFEVLVVVVILIVLAGLLLPVLSPHRPHHHSYCINNLKQIGLSFRLWSGDNDDKYPMQVSTAAGGTMELGASGNVFPHFQVMSNELSTPILVLCPDDTKRKAAASFRTGFGDTNISYFLNVDATNDGSQMILAGDRNLTVNGRLAAPGLLTLDATNQLGWGTKIHHNAGNLLMADGSVQGLTSAALMRGFNLPTNAPIRVAIP